MSRRPGGGGREGELEFEGRLGEGNVCSAAGPALFRLHPQKGLTICVFFSLPSLQKSGRNRFLENLTEGLKI